MDRRQFSFASISPGHVRRANFRPAQLTFILCALLAVLGSLVLAYTLSNSPPLTHALTRRIAPPQRSADTISTRLSQQYARVPLLKTPLFQGNSHLPEVALTFDDGPQPFFTPQILAILQRFNVKATFFCIGQQVMDYPVLVRQESADGDLVEDHTWSHPNLNTLRATAIYQQLALAAHAIYQATATTPHFFRPPYGSANTFVITQATRLNLSAIMWNVDPRDWSLPGTAAIIARVLGAVNNGAIILLHDGGGNRAQTVAALPTIIRTLQAHGFHFVTIQQLVNDLPQTHV